MSFRSILLGVILGLIIASSATTTWLSASGLRTELRKALGKQIETTLDSVTSRIEDLFLPSQRLILTLSNRIKQGELPLDDPTALATAFAQTLRFETGIAWISFGYADGRFAGARVDADGVAINLSNPDGRPPSEWLLEPSGSKIAIQSPALPANFDSRQRIWFKLATERDGMVWTDPYDFASGERGITASQAVLASDGSLLGVLTVDFVLEDIVEYLDGLRQEYKGDTLVFSFNGNVIATPQEVRSEEAVTYLRTMLAHEEDTVRHDRRTVVTEITAGDGQFIVGVQAAEVPGDLECLSTIIFDRAEVFGPVEQVAKRSLLAALIVLIIALGIGFVLARRIAKPLGSLAEEVSRIGNFDLDQRPIPESSIREMTLLLDAVARMRSGLKSFSHYVPIDLVRDLLQNGGVASLGGEKREITIAFADLAGFTSMAENISPEASVQILEAYFEKFGSAIDRNGGVIDKFLGDGIMALFNAPEKIPAPDAAACRAALQGCAALASPTDPTRTLHVRVGLLTGEALVGNFGTKDRFSFTAIGDSVNLCSRLEGLNKYYGTTIIAAESVRRRAGDDEFLWRHLDRVAVVGRSEPLDIHELIAFRIEADPQTIHLATAYSTALGHFLNRQLTEALNTLGDLPMRDEPSKQLADRIHQLLSNPNEFAWDGIHRFTKK